MCTYWYFAYGSNLSKEQKEDRTGSIIEARRARLSGYRIAFNKRGSDGTAKASITPDDNGNVWGVAYRCSMNTLKQMDKHEGVDDGHYRRIEVEIYSDSGTVLDAFTYVAGPKYIIDSISPSNDYFNIIICGARHHGLPDSYIEELYKLAWNKP